MKKILLVLIIALCFLLLPSCKKDKAEEIITEGELSYRMDLCFDPKEHTISGTETVIIRNTSADAWDQLCFRDYPSDKRFQKKINSGITEITDISIIYPSGKKAKGTYERDKEDGTILFFGLEKALKPEELIKISFDFCTYIPKNDDRFGYSENSHCLGYFFPILSIYEEGDWVNHPTFAMGECAYSECAEFDVKVKVPEGYTVITTGEEVPNAEQLTFRAENVRDFTMIIGNNYDVATADWNGVEVNSYYVRGNEEGGKKILEAAIDAMEAYSEAIGPYPYASIDYAETSFEGGALGMEYPQLIMIQEGLGSLDQIHNLDLTRLVTAHETAHQWFYGIIGNDQYKEAWIDEGFATYLENVFYEHIGELTFEEIFSRTALPASFSGNQRLGGEALNQSYSDFPNSNAYARTVYTRGGEFLLTLRNTMGDEAFYAAVREIYEKYRFEEVNTEQVLDIFKSYTEEDLTGLYKYYFN